MAASWETSEALKNANALVRDGAAGKDEAQVAAGMTAQQQALSDLGIVMPTAESRNAAIKEAGGIVPAEPTSTGGTSQKLVDELKGLYSGGSEYSQALAAQLGANEAAVRQSVSELQAQKTQTDQSYADTFRQLYIQKKNAQKNLGQQLAAQGINGGASESTLLDLETSYAEALRQGEQERINAQNELDRAISQAKLTGEIQNAQLISDSVRERTTGYASILQTLLNRQDNWDMHNETVARDDAATTAQLLAAAGDFSGYQSYLGLTDEKVTALNEHYARGDKLTIAQILGEAGDYSGYKDLLGLTDEQVAVLEANHNSDKLLTAAELMAQAGDFSGYKDLLGLTDGQVATLEKWYKKSASSVSSSGGQVGNVPTLQWSNVEEWATLYGEDSVEDYIGENYKALGYSSKSAALSGWNNYKRQNGLYDDGTWSGVTVHTHPGNRVTYEWNGRVYNHPESVAEAFAMSGPSTYAIRKMNEFLASVDSEYRVG